MTNHSKLSDSELCAAVAPLVGWVNGYSQDAQDRLLSWSGIGLVVEAMREKGWFVSIEQCSEFWSVCFESDKHHADTPDKWTLDPIPWRAVHLAVLSTLEEK